MKSQGWDLQKLKVALTMIYEVVGSSPGGILRRWGLIHEVILAGEDHMRD
jgi:hypothetical protein